MNGFRRSTIVVAVVAGLALVAAPAYADIFYQQDFESAPYLTSSDYTYHLLTGDDPDYAYGYPYGLYDEGYYGVGTNPADYHVSWASFGDHTTGSGNMMIVNGAADAGAVVWSDKTTALTSGQQYYFSAYMTSVYPQAGADPISPAVLAFSINGNLVGGDVTLSGPVGAWELLYVPWTADTTGPATISVINRNLVASGNDFAMDDIYLADHLVPLPGALLLGMLGLGFSGMRLRRQR